MVRYFSVVIFFIAFFLHTFDTGIIIASFYSNQKYIAKNFCINKNNPNSRCCGKCQLTKKLNQEDNKDKQTQGRKSENKIEIASLNASAIKLYPISKCVTRLYEPYQQRLFSSYSYICFHPPKFLVNLF